MNAEAIAALFVLFYFVMALTGALSLWLSLGVRAAIRDRGHSLVGMFSRMLLFWPVMLFVTWRRVYEERNAQRERRS